MREGGEEERKREKGEKGGRKRESEWRRLHLSYGKPPHQWRLVTATYWFLYIVDVFAVWQRGGGSTRCLRRDLPGSGPGEGQAQKGSLNSPQEAPQEAEEAASMPERDSW